jgi:V-type H+-transporting ATPase subunit E
MRKRHELMDKLSEDVLEKIKEFAQPKNNDYRSLIKQLIVQGMVKMLEKNLLIRVRNSDIDFVKKYLNECEEEYSKIMLKETEETYKCTLTVDDIHLDNQWYINI